MTTKPADDPILQYADQPIVGNVVVQRNANGVTVVLRRSDARLVQAANVTRGVMRDDRGQARRVNRLELLIHDGRRILLLPGRDERELKWVASAIKPGR